MKNQVVKGSVILIFAGILCKILGAFYRIPLSNILGAEGMGIYQMIFPVFSLCLILASGGIVNTMSQLIARARVSGENIFRIFKQGFFYCVILGGVLSLIIFIFSSKISVIQGSVDSALGYKIASVTLFATCLVVPFRGYFQGYENMMPTAVSQIIEQTFKVFLGLTLAVIFLKNGLAFGVMGAFLGILLGEILAFIYLLIKFKFNKNNIKNSEKTLKYAKKTQKNNFFSINFQLTLNFLIIPLLAVIDSFLVVNIMQNYFTSAFATSLYGLQSGMVNSLINFPVVISVSISLALLPSISYLIKQNEYQLASESVLKVFEILWIILLPCVVIFFTLSELITSILYPALDENLIIIASRLLQISSVEVMLISFLQISSISLQALGKNFTPAVTLLVCGIIKIILTIILVTNPQLNIYGMAISGVIFYMFAVVITTIMLKSELKFFLPLKVLFVTLGSCVVLGEVLWLANYYIVDIMLKFTIFGIALLIFYLLPLIIFNVIDRKMLGRIANKLRLKIRKY